MFLNRIEWSLEVSKSDDTLLNKPSFTIDVRDQWRLIL